MFGLGKKKEEEKAVEQPIQEFKTNDGKFFKDPKTGQAVYQKPLSSDDLKLLMTAIQKNGECGQKFLHASRLKLVHDENLIKTNAEVTESEKVINEAMKKVRDNMKLDSQWGFNMALGVFEKRISPEA